MRYGVWVLATLLACGQACGQSEKITAEREPVSRHAAGIHPDTVTAAHGAMVWKDATGAVVPFFFQFGFGGSAWTDEMGGMFLDSNGIMWSFGSIVCGGPQNICPPYAQYNGYAYPMYFDGTNCTGNAYVPYVHAGMAFTIQSPTSSNTIRALNANASVSMQFMQSTYGGGGQTTCSGTIVHVLVAPLADAPVVTPPAALPFTLPLQPVMLN